MRQTEDTGKGNAEMKKLMIPLVVIACMSVMAVGLTGCKKKAAPTPPSQADVEAAKQAVATAPAAPEATPPGVVPAAAAEQAKAAQAAMEKAAAQGTAPAMPAMPSMPPVPPMPPPASDAPDASAK